VPSARADGIARQKMSDVLLRFGSVMDVGRADVVVENHTASGYRIDLAASGVLVCVRALGRSVCMCQRWADYIPIHAPTRLSST